MILRDALRALFKLIAWVLVVAAGYWWVTHIMLQYSEGPPAQIDPPARRVVQEDGSVILIPPIVTITAAPR